MNSSFLEQYVKAKDYVLRKELFPLIWEYKLNLEEVLLLIYFMNEDVPTFDVEQINKITMISVNKILDSFTSLTNKGLISIDVIKENSGVKEVVNLDPIYKCMIDGLMKNNKKVAAKNPIEFFAATFLLFFFVFQFSSDDTSENGSERSNNDSGDDCYTDQCY